MYSKNKQSSHDKSLNLIINKHLSQHPEHQSKKTASISTSNLKEAVSKAILKEKRAEKITYEKLSKQSGLALSTLKAIAYGKTLPNIEQWFKLCQILPGIRGIENTFLGLSEAPQIVSDRELGVSIITVLNDMIGCKNNYSEEHIENLRKSCLLIERKILYSEFITLYQR